MGLQGGEYGLKEKLRRYWTLFLATFQLSACTFGGGFVIIPLMRRKFVERLGWIEEQPSRSMRQYWSAIAPAGCRARS